MNQDIRSIYITINSDPKKQVYVNETTTCIYGEETIDATLAGYTYQLYPQSSFQLNSTVAIEFYDVNQTVVRPNPVQGNKLELLYYSDHSEELSVDIFSASGQLVRRLNFQTTGAESVFDINIDQLSNGVYFLKTTQLNHIQTIRFVKTN